MAATVTDLANGTGTTSTTTVVTGATVTATVVDRDWLVVVVAGDNNGTAGAASLTTVVDSGGANVYTQRTLVNQDPGAAGDGATLGIYTCEVAANITSGTITANFSPATTAKAIQVYRVRPGTGETVKFVAAEIFGIAGSVSGHTAPTAAMVGGDIIFGAAAIETNTAITGDSDTTNGSWSAVITRLADVAATDLSSMSCASQFKTTTATGNQSWACSTAVAKDSARNYLILQSSNDSLRGIDVSVGPNIPPAFLKKGLTAALIASGAVVGPLSPMPPPTQYNYGFHNERHVYRPIKPAVGRLGSINLAPAQPPPIAFTTTEWIFSPFSQPVRVYQHRRGEVASPPGGFSFQQPAAQTPTELWWPRWQEPPHRLKASPRLAGFVAWPGIGYTTTVPVPTPTNWWRTQWTDPSKFLSPRRSVGLLGQVAWDPPQQAAPTQYNFEVHNERHLYSPAKRSPDLLGGPDTWPAQVPTAVVAVTLSPGPWSGVPAAYWAQRRNWRLAASWPWQAYSFTIPAATPSALWFPVWQERPKERKRSVYLRQGSWAGWDPQFIIQITPPAVLEGVTFTFGLKRGASATPGTKEGATMTGQRKTGGATLITRVKPRLS